MEKTVQEINPPISPVQENTQENKPSKEPPTKSRKPLFWIIVSVIVVVLVSFGSYLITQQNKTEAPKVYHIGVLSGLSFFADTTDGFKSKMTELGYIEGKNVIYDVQKSEFDIANYQKILNKFILDKDDLILTFPTEASIEAKAATKDTSIPVVFANAFTDDTNLVDSIRNPGGNVTGVRWDGPDLAIQRFRILKQLVPTAKEVWIPYQMGYPIVKSQLTALRPVLKEENIKIVEIPASNSAELGVKLREEKAKTINTGETIVILEIAEPLLTTPDSLLTLGEFASKYKIPIGGNFAPVGQYQSIFGLTPQNIPQGKQAAIIANEILKGTSAGTIPVVSADNFLTINYKMAKQLGITVPENLLDQANQIIR